MDRRARQAGVALWGQVGVKMDTGSRPLFNLLDVCLDDLELYPNAFEDIMHRRYDGMVIRRVFSREAIEVVLQRVLSGSYGLEPQGIAVHGAGGAYPVTIPRTLINSAAEIDLYHEKAGPFRAQLRALFEGHGDFEAHMQAVFSRMSGGRRVSVPSGPAGEPYIPASLRVLPPGSEIGLHSGNDLLLNLPENGGLRRMLDCEDQLSYFTPLQAAEQGGQLMLYTLEYQHTDQGKTVNGLPLWFAIHGFDDMPVLLEPGDVVLFDGGRIYHRVSPVEGARPRVTLGGFLAFSADHADVYYWS